MCENLFDTLHALLVSLEVALISAVIATVLGTAASLGIASMGRGSRLVVTNITYIHLRQSWT